MDDMTDFDLLCMAIYFFVFVPLFFYALSFILKV